MSKFAAGILVGALSCADMGLVRTALIAMSLAVVALCLNAIDKSMPVRLSHTDPKY